MHEHGSVRVPLDDAHIASHLCQPANILCTFDAGSSTHVARYQVADFGVGPAILQPTKRPVTIA